MRTSKGKPKYSIRPGWGKLPIAPSSFELCLDHRLTGNYLCGTDGDVTSGLPTIHPQHRTSRTILDPMTHKVANYAVLACAIFLVHLESLAAQKDSQAFQFNQFPVDVYHGHLKIPREFHKDRDGLWVDESGKPTFAPRVNFAGEYYLAVHSCGTCCRYYTLDNLRTGGEIGRVRRFDAGDPAPTTKDGHTYVPILFFKPDSRLLIVQYELDLCTPVERNQCRQRYFVFEDGRFRSISKIMPSCTREGQEPD